MNILKDKEENKKNKKNKEDKENKKIKILLADDEADLSRALGVILKYNNYEAKIVSNGKEALEATENEKFDLIILDIMMPIMDGTEALKHMRNNGIKTPIMLLTAKSQIDDKVEGLDAGANDYLTKPFDKKELLARIRALTRNNEGKKEYKIGNVYFNKETAELSSGKTLFHLNAKECEMMEVLANNQNKVLSKEELQNKIWQTEEEKVQHKDDNILTMYTSYLQDKLKALNADVKINCENGYNLEKIE